MSQPLAVTQCCRCERTDANYLDAGSRMYYASCGHAL
jgi:hypothetical protein